MLNRFQLHNKGVWASKTVSSAQCIAWPSPTLFLLLVCQAVNIMDIQIWAGLEDNGLALELDHSSAVQQTLTDFCEYSVCVYISRPLKIPWDLQIQTDGDG